jgi:hypothetical protein
MYFKIFKKIDHYKESKKLELAQRVQSKENNMWSNL